MWTNLDPELLRLLPKKPMNGSTLPRSTWSDIASTLAEFRDEYTEDGWDGLSASAIPAEVIESTQILASILEARGIAAPSWTLPTYESSVSFEWDDYSGTTVEIVVATPDCLTVTTCGPSYGYKKWAGSIGSFEL